MSSILRRGTSLVWRRIAQATAGVLFFFSQVGAPAVGSNHGQAYRVPILGVVQQQNFQLQSPSCVGSNLSYLQLHGSWRAPSQLSPGCDVQSQWIGRAVAVAVAVIAVVADHEVFLSGFSLVFLCVGNRPALPVASLAATATSRCQRVFVRRTRTARKRSLRDPDLRDDGADSDSDEALPQIVHVSAAEALPRLEVLERGVGLRDRG